MQSWKETSFTLTFLIQRDTPALLSHFSVVHRNRSTDFSSLPFSSFNIHSSIFLGLHHFSLFIHCFIVVVVVPIIILSLFSTRLWFFPEVIIISNFFLISVYIRARVSCVVFLACMQLLSTFLKLIVFKSWFCVCVRARYCSCDCLNWSFFFFHWFGFIFSINFFIL